jgi:sialic acid synthase SpsE
MKIGSFDLHSEVLVVAEIGNNHEGKFQNACELVKRAAQCGVPAVKFQTYRTEYYVSPSDQARFKRLKSFELSQPQFEELSILAHSLGLLFISTPFDLESARLLEPLVDAYKIASGDINFYPLIAAVARTGKPLIISTGLSELEQVAKTVSFVEQQWSAQGREQELAVLHCVSCYPVPPEQANLLSIPVLSSALRKTVGYSDHTIGFDAAPLAVALGARIIEKHFTLDRHFSDFRDHLLSLDPDGMCELVARVRTATRLLGVRSKTISPCEEAIGGAIRRSIVAAADLEAGHRIQGSDLTWIRPGGGLVPGEEAALIGRILKRKVHFAEQIQLSDVT